MPIYEYRCKTNGHRFEMIQKLSDPPPATCRECDSPVEKLLSASAFVLKGSGFYVNDYARKGAPAADAPAKDAAPSPKSDKSDKTESKPSACAGGACAPVN